jgi:FkbM family methyltransferase
MLELIQNLIRKNVLLYYLFRKIINFHLFVKFYRPELKILSKIKCQINFIDIGSNDGIFVNLIISKFKSKIKKIYIIEPINNLNQNLKLKFRGFRYVNIFKCLVSNNRKKQKIFIPYFKIFKYVFYLSGYASNRISAVKFDLNQYFSKKLINEKIFFKHEVINTRKIDDLKINANFIKIIMAGCQYNILKGSEKTIKKNKPIIYLNQRTDKVEKYLSRFGYKKFIYDHSKKKLFKLKKFSKNHHVVFFLSNSTIKKLFI